MSISEKVLQLAEEIKKSNEYTILRHAKITIDANLPLKRKIEEYKRKEKDTFASARYDKDFESRMAALNKVIQDLSAIPEISHYLKAEKEFNELLQKILITVSNSLEYSLK